MGRPRSEGTKHLVVGAEVVEDGFNYHITDYDKHSRMLTCLSLKNGNIFKIRMYDAYRRGIHSADNYYPSVYGVGYIGEGAYSPTMSWKMTQEYMEWKNMLQRCYHNRKDGNNKTYLNTVVVDEKWHNFQVFAEWFYDSNYQKGWNLDKDLLGDGLVYSENTCVFLPTEVNSHLRQPRNKKDGKHLPFAVFDHHSGSYRVVDRETNKLKYFKDLATAISFRNETLRVKLEGLADKYRRDLPKVAFDKLNNFNSEEFYAN
jgi:hypothetical protein